MGYAEQINHLTLLYLKAQCRVLFSEPRGEKKLKRSHSEDLVSANRDKIKKIEEWRRLKQANSDTRDSSTRLFISIFTFKRTVA